MSIELIGCAEESVPLTALRKVFARIRADPRYSILFESGGTLRGQLRSLGHTAPEREDFELAVSGARVVLSFYSGTLGDIDAARRDVERFFADEAVVVSLEEE